MDNFPDSNNISKECTDVKQLALQLLKTKSSIEKEDIYGLYITDDEEFELVKKVYVCYKGYELIEKFFDHNEGQFIYDNIETVKYNYFIIDFSDVEVLSDLEFSGITKGISKDIFEEKTKNLTNLI